MGKGREDEERGRTGRRERGRKGRDGKGKIDKKRK